MALTWSDPGLFRACGATADGRAQKAAAAHAAAVVRAGESDGLQPGVSQKKMDKLLSLGDETHLPLAYSQRKQSGLAKYDNLRAFREPRVSLRARTRGARAVEAQGGERLGEQGGSPGGSAGRADLARVSLPDKDKALTTEEMRAVAGFRAPCPASSAR